LMIKLRLVMVSSGDGAAAYRGRAVQLERVGGTRSTQTPSEAGAVVRAVRSQ